MRNLTENEMTVVNGGGFYWPAFWGENCKQCGKYMSIAALCAAIEVVLTAGAGAAAGAATGGVGAAAGATAGSALAAKITEYIGAGAASIAIPYCLACADEVWE